MEKTAVHPDWENYEEVIHWLFEQLPNYQNQGTSAYKPGLDKINRVLKSLGNPQNKFRSIHIAGTNGKGSVAHIMAAIYQNNGYHTAVFTSPHISDFRERIKINGEYIPKDWVLQFLRQNFSLFKELKTTFFEITTAMAFQFFADEEVDIAIVETGLGGRLDATNVLTPLLSIITTVSKDHTQFLGDSLSAIASEKAGIIKEDVPVLIGEVSDDVKKVIKDIASTKHAIVNETDDVMYMSDLSALYQKKNIATAVTAVKVLEQTYPINEKKLKDAVKNVCRLTRFRGRFQKIGKEPDVILDVAHNVAGVKALLNEVQLQKYSKWHFIFGSSSDKDLESVFKLFPKKAEYYFTEFDSSRTASLEQMSQLASRQDLSFQTFYDPKEALYAAKNSTTKSDLILVFGSVFLMDAILKHHE